MDLEDDDEFFQDFVNNVLDKATVAIVEKLEPKGLLDIFVQCKIIGDLTNVKIRDIKDERITSEQNRAIRELVRGSGNYMIFKEGLKSTGQHGLLQDLEAIEKEIHDSLKGPWWYFHIKKPKYGKIGTRFENYEAVEINNPHRCDSTESCHLLQQVKHQQLRISSPTSKIIQELQQHLLSIYEEENMYWENPVTAEEVYLSEMYVHPSVKRIRELNEHGEMKEVEDQNVLPSKLLYKDIFKSKSGGLCQNIYITGEAGTGKSTFCNQLVTNWCSLVLNKPTNNLPSEDKNLLSSFSFLFHINLRETEKIYHVEEMIQEQLLSYAAGDLNISDKLKTERCLIVLDGLDEWACPDNAKKCPNINKNIPGRNKAYKNCVFITTSRDWKYDVIALRNKDIDKHVEISGIHRDESEELANRLLDHLDRDMKSNKNVSDFLTDVHQRKLNDFLSVPVLLIQLITLWFFGKDFGNSQLQLYCSMLDLLFERSEKNLPEEISKCSSPTVANLKELPKCFSTKDNCQKYAQLIGCLAKLAYKSLFNEQKEEALVFKSSRLDIFGISPSDIKLCLQCGILSQSKDYGNRTGQFKKYSFLHKKVQESMSALFLVTNDNFEEILKEVKQFCKSVETMLEMNQVWLFVAGMDPDMTKRLFECLGDVVSGDELITTYRQMLGYERVRVRLVERIQNCVFDCVSEGLINEHRYENLRLEDFYIDSRNIREVERLVFCSDMSKVKSVYVVTRDIDASKIEAVTGQFLQCRSLQKLYLYDNFSTLISGSDPSIHIPKSTVAALIENNCDSLTSLYLNTEITATDKLVTDICKSISKFLMALKLIGVTLTHRHKEQILDSLSKSPVIRQLVLSLECTDHDNECRPRIDLSAMTQLNKLTLEDMYVDNLQFLPHCLEKVELSSVTLSVTSLRDFTHGLSQTRRNGFVKLSWVTFKETREECGDLADFLRNSPGLKLSNFYDWDNTWEIEFNTNSQ